ncbi:MAG: hypothetical protein ABGX72_06615 [Methyloprofundus sp.]
MSNVIWHKTSNSFNLDRACLIALLSNMLRSYHGAYQVDAEGSGE